MPRFGRQLIFLPFDFIIPRVESKFMKGILLPEQKGKDHFLQGFMQRIDPSIVIVIFAQKVILFRNWQMQRMQIRKKVEMFARIRK